MLNYAVTNVYSQNCKAEYQNNTVKTKTQEIVNKNHFVNKKNKKSILKQAAA